MNSMPPPPRVSSDGAFVEFPGLLIIRLMSACNQSCVFCMTKDEIASSGVVDYDEAARVIARQPAGARIEFFGGEPTIHPRFLDLVGVARQRGHDCSIATNGRKLSDQEFVARLAALGSGKIYVRTTVYGDTADVHDYYTNVRGSHAETMRGIRNVVDHGFRVQVNIVILEKNFERLPELAKQINECGVPRIKFGNLVDVESCGPHAVPLSHVSPHLVRAIEISERLGLTVTVEKTPMCAIAGRIDLVSTERVLGQWPRDFNDTGVCGECLVRRWCDGLDPGYVSVFGFGGIHKLDEVPAAAVERCLGREPEFLKFYCVRVENELIDDETARELYAILQTVTAQHGRLAVFPSRYIGAGSGVP